MMRSVWLAIICVGLFLSAPAYGLVVTMSITAEGDDRPVIVGKTNLPDGTVVVVALSRPAGGYADEVTTSVQNGGFRAGPFDQHGLWLSPGIYDVQVSVPVASMQPPNVQAVIGKHGEKLKGPLVKAPDFFKVGLVEYHQSLVIGDLFDVERDKARPEAERRKHDLWFDFDSTCRSLCDLAQSDAAKMYQWYDWQACYQRCLDRE